jgi:hypothetical protein
MVYVKTGTPDNEAPENARNSAQIMNSRNAQQVNRCLTSQTRNNSLTVRLPSSDSKINNANNSSNSGMSHIHIIYN